MAVTMALAQCGSFNSHGDCCVSIVVETEEVTVMAICELVDALDANLFKPGYFGRSIDWTQALKAQQIERVRLDADPSKT
jgi:hypothetical protein